MVWLYSTSAVYGGGWSTPHPVRFTSGTGTQYPLYGRLGWAPRPDWTAVENLDPTGIPSPDRPARSKSLYRLSYPDLPQKKSVER